MATYIRKPKYNLTEYRKTNFNKRLKDLTQSQLESYEKYKEYIRDYKGFRRDRLRASKAVLYENTIKKTKGRTQSDIQEIWKDYNRKKDRAIEKYEDSLAGLYKFFNIREHKLKTVTEFRFKTKNTDRYSRNKKMKDILTQQEGYIQIIIPYKDSAGKTRYYSKSFYNDPEFILQDYDSYEDYIDDLLMQTDEFFEDDAGTYNATDSEAPQIVFTSPDATRL